MTSENWHRRGCEYEIFIASHIDKEYLYENYIATKILMKNMTKKQRGDWLAKWLMLGFMDVMWPRVSRLNVGLVVSEIFELLNVLDSLPTPPIPIVCVVLTLFKQECWWGIIAHPYPSFNFNGSLVKQPLKLWHGRVPWCTLPCKNIKPLVKVTLNLKT